MDHVHIRRRQLLLQQFREDAIEYMSAAGFGVATREKVQAWFRAAVPYTGDAAVTIAHIDEHDLFCCWHSALDQAEVIVLISDSFYVIQELWILISHFRHNCL